MCRQSMNLQVEEGDFSIQMPGSYSEFRAYSAASVAHGITVPTA